jgi:hypothetical protein
MSSKKKMNNKMEVLFDYRTKKPTRGRTRSSTAAKDNVMYTTGERIRKQETNSVELGPWLDDFDNKKKIYNMRLFYVLLPNSESVVKFGIAGTRGEAGGWGRLHSYINEYGYTSDLNACTGIQMLYLAGNQYNSNVEITNSDVFKKERACKQYFRAPEVKAHLIGRGFERINLDRIQELFDIIDDPSNKDFGDVETERRVSERLSQQNLTADDYVVKITSHTTKGGKSKAMTQYTCYWNRPAVLTQKKLVKKLNPNPRKDSDLRDAEIDRQRDAKRFQTEETSRVEDHTTKEFYKNIVLFKNGSKAMEIYKSLHPEGKFRD